MKSLVVVLFLMVAFVAIPSLSSTAVAQGFDRDGCLRDCEPLKPIARGMNWAAYQRCVADCERQFWDEYDENIKDLERERDK